ncbi:uncharacterized protein LOC120291653 [Eucalyptus grandis]|uniref:uncharacterized protein LOC120291653 n=1 Tax=Eucalyptus grandis TaxID=71139 RepID=UPI00192F0C64|nr:uncharacterized protein LOC120291653 [Eucalyptus grandis]
MVKEILSSTEMCPVNVLPIPPVHLHVVHRSSGLRPISSLRRTRHQLRLRATAAAAAGIRALFWWSKKSLEPRETVDLSLGYYALTAPGAEDVAAAESRPKHISPSVVNSISEVSADDWDACALDATGPVKHNPFLSHGFLSSLEESNSAVKETGWMPRHIGAKDESGTVIGVVPLYLKRFILFFVLRIRFIFSETSNR